MSGKVYLVGAGPGDPGLLTLRGVECLAQADLVLYDALANPRLLEHAPIEAERRLVGKRQGRPVLDQKEIDELLVAEARRGKTVVRLKGGDPFLFGRGGEEAEACARAGIPLEVVPGVSSAVAVPAYAGIPVTHRQHASTVTVVSGRSGEGTAGGDPDWGALARLGGTLVFLMAITRAEEISKALIEAGLDPATETAAIRWGTIPRQQTLRCPLVELAARIAQAEMRPPGVLVVGEVAAMADRLAWYEKLPLFGRRIVVTRARSQASAFVDRLERLGAETIACPTIEITDAADAAPFDRAVQRLSDYDWLLLTSVNGVERFFSGLAVRGHDLRELAGVRIAAIGPATAAAVERRGLCVAATPSEYRAEALLAALGPVEGLRILLARALVAREILPDELGKRGATVDVVPVYCSLPPALEPPWDELERADLVSFTSSSTVTNFLALDADRSREVLVRSAIAAIGPITAETLEHQGFAVDVMPRKYTIPALIDEIIRFFAKQERSS